MKRFYHLVTSVRDGDHFHIHLDGKPVRTPSGTFLVVPGEALANHIVQEWANQADMIVPDTMPLTQIMTTALERGGQDRDAIEKSVMAYLDTDLLCYRTQSPEALVLLQAEKWDPWLRWFEGRSGVMLETTTDIAALTQQAKAHDYVRTILQQADRWEFTALQMVTAASGSLVLALAFVAGDAGAEDVFAAAQLEELYRSALYNEEFYGRDPNQEKAQDALMRDLNALRLFLDSLKP